MKRRREKKGLHHPFASWKAATSGSFQLVHTHPAERDPIRTTALHYGIDRRKWTLHFALIVNMAVEQSNLFGVWLFSFIRFSFVSRSPTISSLLGSHLAIRQSETPREVFSSIICGMRNDPPYLKETQRKLGLSRHIPGWQMSTSLHIGEQPSFWRK